jgi:flavin-dependent dehydrogenase
MARGEIRSVAILGGGPAGAALGTFLARAGVDVTLFDGGKRPPLIVGESLVPAVVPFLRALGIEDEVASYSTFKPGATFTFDEGDTMSFLFGEVRSARTPYSYNVPRDRLDRSVREAALRAGVRLVPRHGRVAVDAATGDEEGSRRMRAAWEDVGAPGHAATGDEAARAAAPDAPVRLAAESLEAAGLGAQPDFVVDAAGRVRLLGRLLELPVVEGGRRDTALHTHLEGVPLLHQGHVHTDRLEHGWSWRIPLPGRVSVGLVIDAAVLREFGDSAEEQFDAYLRHDRRLREWGAYAKRIAPVVKYTNYQLRHTRGVGPNWALLGDAFGFVDPVFSSGMLVGLDAARELAATLLAGAGPERLARYEAHVLHHLANWHRVAGWFYDGRLFTLLKLGDEKRDEFPWQWVDPHFRKHLPRVFTGESTTKRYSTGLLGFMVRFALFGTDPGPLAIR